MSFMYGRMLPLGECGKIGSGHEQRWNSPGMSPVATVELTLTVWSRAELSPGSFFECRVAIRIK
jgi:hypothetical protein